uniref:Uncharacterized protein n=1 Tax=Anguilla anguilla TaxID=7936 RepID=A0A0E9PCK6_ANGAN
MHMAFNLLIMTAYMKPPSPSPPDPGLRKRNTFIHDEKHSGHTILHCVSTG